jgi:hypothetical protein
LATAVNILLRIQNNDRFTENDRWRAVLSQAYTWTWKSGKKRDYHQPLSAFFYWFHKMTWNNEWKSTCDML